MHERIRISGKKIPKTDHKGMLFVLEEKKGYKKPHELAVKIFYWTPLMVWNLVAMKNKRIFGNLTFNPKKMGPIKLGSEYLPIQ